jgi:hypothetical protein
MKIHPVGAELFHADGRTDMNLIAAFRNIRTRLKVDFLQPTHVRLLKQIKNLNNGCDSFKVRNFY